MPTVKAESAYRHDLGDGLIARWSTAQDTENIVQLTGFVFRTAEDEPLNPRMIENVRQQMSGDFPLMGPGDYALIEDTRKAGNPLVACTCLWRHVWEYEGIPFGIGRPEFVATLPGYRNRGLIRALFEMVHARSEAEGHLVQAITGIPYFYRQFGYEYALDLGGRRVTYLSLIPNAQENVPELYTMRVATLEDIPHLMELYNRRRAESIVWTILPERYWRYQIETWNDYFAPGRAFSIQMIVDTEGKVQGYAQVGVKRWGPDLSVDALEVAEGVNLQAVIPSLLRALKAFGVQIPAVRPTIPPFSEISFFLGRTHPVYEVLGQTLAPYYQQPYAWYVRVPDLPAFLQHIAPALEKRLANSVITGYTGELKLDFYRDGLRIVFDKGHLVNVEKWRPPIWNSNADAGLPGLVFLQLLFGFRTFDELRFAFPDVRASSEAEVLLKVLFPTKPSWMPDI